MCQLLIVLIKGNLKMESCHFCRFSLQQTCVVCIIHVRKRCNLRQVDIVTAHHPILCRKACISSRQRTGSGHLGCRQCNSGGFKVSAVHSRQTLADKIVILDCSRYHSGDRAVMLRVGLIARQGIALSDILSLTGNAADVVFCLHIRNGDTVFDTSVGHTGNTAGIFAVGDLYLTAADRIINPAKSRTSGNAAGIPLFCRYLLRCDAFPYCCLHISFQINKIRVGNLYIFPILDRGFHADIPGDTAGIAAAVNFTLVIALVNDCHINPFAAHRTVERRLDRDNLLFLVRIDGCGKAAKPPIKPR